MRDRAKLFKSGGSQAVRSPKDYRFEDQDEVVIYRQGNRVILEGARREWRDEFLALAGAARDFPYPEEPPAAESGPDFGWMRYLLDTNAWIDYLSGRYATVVSAFRSHLPTTSV